MAPTFTPITAGARRNILKKKDRFFYRRLVHIVRHWPRYEPFILEASRRYSDLTKAEIKRKVEEYLKAAVRKGEYGYVDVMYHPPASNIGRAYTHTPSLQNLVRILRHAITYNIHLDLDIINAMPTLLSQYAEKNGLDLETLKRYVTDRKKMLKELEAVSGLSYEDGKAAVHSLLNNGTRLLESRAKPEWVTYLVSEMHTLLEFIQTHETEIWTLALEKADKKRAAGGNYNPQGSAMSMLYGHLEHQCLMCIHNKLKEKKLLGRNDTDTSLIFDGCMFLIPDESVDQKKLLCELEMAVQLGTGYRVQLIFKPMHNNLGIPDDDDLDDNPEAEEDNIDIEEAMGWKDNKLGAMLRHFTNHTVAAFYLEERGGNIRYCGKTKRWYCIDDPNKSCVWEESDSAIGLEDDIPKTITEVLLREQKKIMEWPAASNHPQLEKVGVNIEVKYLNTIGSTIFIQQTITKLRSMRGVRHDNFAEALDSNPWSLAFSDQVLDLRAMTWRAMTPEDHIHKTTGYPRPTSNPQIRTQIQEIIRGMVLGDDCYQYLMSVLASCLPGLNMFQEFYIFQGPGGNGKSLIYHIMSGALGGPTGAYFEKVRSQCVVKSSRAANDHDDWGKTRGARAYWIPEVKKGDVLQEDVIRQQTGGEDIVARDPGAKTITFRATATPLAGFNDMPRIPNDESIQRRLRVLSFPYLFVHRDRIEEERDNPMLKLRVNAYEHLFKQSSHQQEFMLMLIEQFEDHVLGKDSLQQSVASTRATVEAIWNGDRFTEFLKNKMVPEPGAYIPTTHLMNMYNADLEAGGLHKIGYKRLKTLMANHGYKTEHKMVGSVYVGIRGLNSREIEDRRNAERDMMEEYQQVLNDSEKRGVKRKGAF